MEHLQPQDSLATYLQNFIYTLGSLQFSDDDQDLVPDVETLLKMLQKHQVQVLSLANEDLRLSAGLRRKLLKVRGAASELESADDLYRKSPAGKGKKSIFEATVSNIFTVMNQADRYAALDTLKGKVDPAPEVMKPAAKRFLTALSELGDVRNQIAALGKKVEALAAEVEAAKKSAITGERRLEGKLTDRHAEEPEVAELPFRPPAPVKKAKKGDGKKEETKPAVPEGGEEPADPGGGETP